MKPPAPHGRQAAGESPADACRRLGWTVGTRLVGDEGYGPTTIRITAIGEVNILARSESHDGLTSIPDEGSWALAHRDWQVVA